jgi:hypothetical protein
MFHPCFFNYSITSIVTLFFIFLHSFSIFWWFFYHRTTLASLSCGFYILQASFMPIPCLHILMPYPEQTFLVFVHIFLLSTPIFHLLVWVLSRNSLLNQSPIYLPIIYSISHISYLLPIDLCICIQKGHIYVFLVNHLSS